MLTHFIGVTAPAVTSAELTLLPCGQAPPPFAPGRHIYGFFQLSREQPNDSPSFNPPVVL